MDGCVYLSHGPVQPGTLCTARVTSVTDYDLLAEANPQDLEAPSRPPVARAKDPRAVLRRRGVVALRTIS